MDAPYGYCGCGCGQKTSIATSSDRRKRAVKGEPRRFVHGHNRRQSPVEYIVDEATGCWVWQLATDTRGYGTTSFNGRRTVKAHIASYEKHVGPVPEGLELDHLCRNKGCVNPAHLEPVT